MPGNKLVLNNEHDLLSRLYISLTRKISPWIYRCQEKLDELAEHRQLLQTNPRILQEKAFSQAILEIRHNDHPSLFFSEKFHPFTSQQRYQVLQHTFNIDPLSSLSLELMPLSQSIQELSAEEKQLLLKSYQDITELTLQKTLSFQKQQDKNKFVDLLKIDMSKNYLIHIPHAEAEEIYFSIRYLKTKKNDNNLPKYRLLKLKNLIKQLPKTVYINLMNFYDQAEAGLLPKHLNLLRLATAYTTLNQVENLLPEMLQQDFIKFIANPDEFELFNSNMLEPDIIEFFLGLITDIEYLLEISYKAFSMHSRFSSIDDMNSRSVLGQFFNYDTAELKKRLYFKPLIQYTNVKKIPLKKDDYGLSSYFYDALNDIAMEYLNRRIPTDVALKTLLMFFSHWHHNILKPKIAEFVRSNKNHALFTEEALITMFKRLLDTEHSHLLFTFIVAEYGRYLTNDFKIVNNEVVDLQIQCFTDLLLRPYEIETDENMKNLFLTCYKKILNEENKTIAEISLLQDSNFLAECANLTAPDFLLSLQEKMPHMSELVPELLKIELAKWQDAMTTIQQPECLSLAQKKQISCLSIQYTFFALGSIHRRLERLIPVIKQGLSEIPIPIVNRKNPCVNMLGQRLLNPHIHRLIRSLFSYEECSLLHEAIMTLLIEEAINYYPEIEKTLMFAKKYKVFRQSILLPIQGTTGLPYLGYWLTLERKEFDYSAMPENKKLLYKAFFHLTHAAVDLVMPVRLRNDYTMLYYLHFLGYVRYDLQEASKAMRKYCFEKGLINDFEINNLHVIHQEIFSQLSNKLNQLFNYLLITTTERDKSEYNALTSFWNWMFPHDPRYQEISERTKTIQKIIDQLGEKTNGALLSDEFKGTYDMNDKFFVLAKNEKAKEIIQRDFGGFSERMLTNAIDALKEIPKTSNTYSFISLENILLSYRAILDIQAMAETVTCVKTSLQEKQAYQIVTDLPFWKSLDELDKEEQTSSSSSSSSSMCYFST